MSNFENVKNIYKDFFWDTFKNLKGDELRDSVIAIFKILIDRSNTAREKAKKEELPKPESEELKPEPEQEQTPEPFVDNGNKLELEIQEEAVSEAKVKKSSSTRLKDAAREKVDYLKSVFKRIGGNNSELTDFPDPEISMDDQVVIVPENIPPSVEVVENPLPVIAAPVAEVGKVPEAKYEEKAIIENQVAGEVNSIKKPEVSKISFHEAEEFFKNRNSFTLDKNEDLIINDAHFFSYIKNSPDDLEDISKNLMQFKKVSFNFKVSAKQFESLFPSTLKNRENNIKILDFKINNNINRFDFSGFSKLNTLNAPAVSNLANVVFPEHKSLTAFLSRDEKYSKNWESDNVLDILQKFPRITLVVNSDKNLSQDILLAEQNEKNKEKNKKETVNRDSIQKAAVKELEKIQKGGSLVNEEMSFDQVKSVYEKVFKLVAEKHVLKTTSGFNIRFGIDRLAKGFNIFGDIENFILKDIDTNPELTKIKEVKVLYDKKYRQELLKKAESFDGATDDQKELFMKKKKSLQNAFFTQKIQQEIVAEVRKESAKHGSFAKMKNFISQNGGSRAANVIKNSYVGRTAERTAPIVAGALSLMTIGGRILKIGLIAQGLGSIFAITGEAIGIATNGLQDVNSYKNNFEENEKNKKRYISGSAIIEIAKLCSAYTSKKVKEYSKETGLRRHEIADKQGSFQLSHIANLLRDVELLQKALDNSDGLDQEEKVDLGDLKNKFISNNPGYKRDEVTEEEFILDVFLDKQEQLKKRELLLRKVSNFGKKLSYASLTMFAGGWMENHIHVAEKIGDNLPTTDYTPEVSTDVNAEIADVPQSDNELVDEKDLSGQADVYHTENGNVHLASEDATLKSKQFEIESLKESLKQDASDHQGEKPVIKPATEKAQSLNNSSATNTNPKINVSAGAKQTINQTTNQVGKIETLRTEAEVSVSTQNLDLDPESKVELKQELNLESLDANEAVKTGDLETKDQVSTDNSGDENENGGGELEKIGSEKDLEIKNKIEEHYLKEKADLDAEYQVIIKNIETNNSSATSELIQEYKNQALLLKDTRAGYIQSDWNDDLENYTKHKEIPDYIDEGPKLINTKGAIKEKWELPEKPREGEVESVDQSGTSQGTEEPSGEKVVVEEVNPVGPTKPELEPEAKENTDPVQKPGIQTIKPKSIDLRPSQNLDLGKGVPVESGIPMQTEAPVTVEQPDIRNIEGQTPEELIYVENLKRGILINDINRLKVLNNENVIPLDTDIDIEDLQEEQKRLFDVLHQEVDTKPDSGDVKPHLENTDSNLSKPSVEGNSTDTKLQNTGELKLESNDSVDSSQNESTSGSGGIIGAIFEAIGKIFSSLFG